ncbi:MAG: choice-of-anchor D domain-containing protein, partial [Verrucomicrobia bacterium]|nr:choice-of-anchor D domain-containing protein [Verrucomicrobiota bacterium]
MAFIGDFPFGTPCFAFNADEYSCAETISHEAGHTLGLHHDGRRTPPEAYYAGHGSGPTAWAPIMGAGYLGTPFKNATQWSCGEYPEADNQEDDVALIASAINAFGYRLDDKGNTKEGASPLGVAGTTVRDAGIIERPSDVDWLRFTAGAGTVALTVEPLDVNSADTMGANLAVKLRLYDANGGLLQEADDPSGLAATLTRTVGTGTYYLTVEGEARGTAASGFTKYGSLGQYTVSGTVPAVVSDPVPPTVAITSPGGGTTDVPGLTVAGTADDNVAVAAVEVRHNGGAWTTAAGTQSWSLAVTLAAGANTLEARARDTSNNLSGVAVRTITYAASAPRLVVEQPAGRALTSGVSSVSFGSRAVGLAFTKTFTLRNAGTAPLTSLAVTLAGANPEDFSVGSLTATSLLPGASATVSVGFAAAAEGMRNATLQIASNDPLRNPFRTGLSGTGLPAPGTQYLWTNLAGMPGGIGSADDRGGAARFNHPGGVAVDGSGNLYVADNGNNTIRKVTSAGVVTTFAGSPGQWGDVDGTGSAARFSYPNGIAVDGNGNLYVANTWSHTIRKVTPAGMVTTLAGRPGYYGSVDDTGNAARFNQPEGIAVDGSGNLYVADTSNHTIRKVTPSGEVTTLAGSPGQWGYVDGTGSDARFFCPTGIAVDGGGSLYVADKFNNTIRKVTPSGEVTTLAGSPHHEGSADGTGSAARFSDPYGIAVDSSGNLYVADYANDTIRKVTAAGVVTTLAGSPLQEGSADGTGGAARFFSPLGIAVDGSGNLYVADEWNHTLRKITPAGLVTTLAGSSGYSGSADGTGSAARYSNPAGISAEGSGNLYVADGSNNTIRKITASGVVTTLAGSPGQWGHVDGTGSAARFLSPEGIAVDGSGNLYVADWGTCTIRKVTPAGMVTTLAGSHEQVGSADGAGGVATFYYPKGIAVDTSGNLYVADYYNCTIRKVTPSGVVTTLAGSPGRGACADGTGSAARFYYPSGIAVDDSGNLYVVELGCTIRKVTPSGVVTTLAGSFNQSGSADGTGNAARFMKPEGIAGDGRGNLYVADTGNHTIRKVTPSGLVTTIGGRAGQGSGNDGIGTAARFSHPEGITVTTSGLIYVADTENNRIVVGTPLAPGAVTPPLTAWRLDQFGTSSNSGAAADAADPDGDGRSNLLEFALNGNPHVSDPALQPVPGRTGNLMRLNYTRRSDALDFTSRSESLDEGLSFAVEWSVDLKADSWSTLGVSETILSDDGTTQDVEATVPLAGPRMFLRLRVGKE